MISRKNAAVGEQIVKKRGSAEARFFRNPDAVQLGHRRPWSTLNFWRIGREAGKPETAGGLISINGGPFKTPADQTNFTRKSADVVKTPPRWYSDA
jgi:hypothetical protein